METQHSVLSQLAQLTPENPEEADARDHIASFVRRQSAFWSRDTAEGHLTASAWITDPEGEKAVLLHHRKLGIWVQPGGHVDDEDDSLQLASRREAAEETGLSSLKLKQAGIFDVDVHRIPARRQEAAHWHLDVRFWWTTENSRLAINDEANELAWLNAAEIEKLTQEESVLRMVRKTLRL